MLQMLKTMRRKALPAASTYDPNRPGTSVLVDLIEVKLAAADITLAQWQDEYWTYGVSPSVVVVFNPGLRNSCAAYDRTLQSKRSTDASKVRAQSNRLRQIAWHTQFSGDNIGLEFNAKQVTLSGAEEQRLKKVARNLIRLAKDWRKAQDEATNQDLAVNAVADLIGGEVYL